MVLAGFALGTGEVTRYLAAYGQRRVRAAVLVAPLPPFLLAADDSPDGIDRSVFDEFIGRIAADRPAAMQDFMDRSYNIDLLGGSRVSDQAWQNSFYVAISGVRRTPRSAASQRGGKTSAPTWPRSPSPS